MWGGCSELKPYRGKVGPPAFAEARRRLELAAAQGRVDAQAALGEMHYDGEGGPKDFEEARRLLGLAAAQGDAVAQSMLGDMHLHGEGGPKNDAEARRLFGFAAEQGNPNPTWSYNPNPNPTTLTLTTDPNADPNHAGNANAQNNLGLMLRNQGGSRDLSEARRLYGLAAKQGHAAAQVNLGTMHYHGQGGAQDLAEAKRLFGLAAAQGHANAQAKLDKAAEAQRAKQQAGADAMMAQLLDEESEEKQAKSAAKSTKSAKKAKKKRVAPAAVTRVCTNHGRGARDAGVEAAIEDSGDVAQKITPAAEPATAPELRAPFIEARAAALVPAAIVAVGRGRGGRGGQCWMQSRSATLASSDGAVCAVAHLLGQASLQVPAGPSFDVGTVSAPVALTAVTSLADAQFNTGRPEAPESTIGGQSTCIICFTNPKSHAAVPCGHQSACGACSAQMKECPVCRSPAREWMHVRVA